VWRGNQCETVSPAMLCCMAIRRRPTEYERTRTRVFRKRLVTAIAIVAAVVLIAGALALI